MAITINTPLSAPTGLAAIVTASGGSLGVGSYSFFVFDRGNSGDYGTATPMWTSPAIYLLNIAVTVANSKIDLSWTSTDSRKASSIIFWKKDSDTYLASSRIGITANSLSLTNYSTQRTNYIPTIEKATKTPHNFTSNSGVGNIVLSGAVGTITIATIAAALAGQSNYYYDGYSQLWMLWSLDSRTATSGRLNLTNSILWSYGGIFNGANFELYSTVPSTGMPLAGLGVGAYSGSANYFYLGKTSLAFCQLVTFETGLTGDQVFGGARPIWTSDGRLENGLMNGNWTAQQFYNNTKNTWVLGGELIYEVNSLSTMSGMSIWAGLRIDYGSRSYVIRDLISRITSFYNFRYGVDNLQNTTVPTPKQQLIDCDWGSFSNGKYADNIPVVWWIMTGADSMNPLPLMYSCNIKVVDSNGNPVAGAILNVILTADGSLKNTGVSDGSGNVPEQLIAYATIKHKVGSGQGYGLSYTDVVLYNPFNIEIIANGYESYFAKSITISSKLNQTITLKPSKSHRSTARGRKLAVTNPELGSDSNLIEL